MKAVEITYRFEARDANTTRPPEDSNAALLRLNNGNRDFAALLDSLQNGTNVVQRIVSVDAGGAMTVSKFTQSQIAVRAEAGRRGNVHYRAVLRISTW